MKMKNKDFLNETFNKLHDQDKLFWTQQSTFFSFSCFVVERDFIEHKKNHVVMNIRDLNVVIQFNAYFVFLQFDILMTVSECEFISVIKCFEFFYQWRVHLNDRHKLIVITHRNQKSFIVVVMSYKNSSAYVQKQIDKIFKDHRHFAKAYVNDIIIFFKILDDHLTHLQKVFDVLVFNNISINFHKTFLNFVSVNFFEQHVTFLKLSTDEQKLHVIMNLIFSQNLTQLKMYLDLIEWFRQYIDHYAFKAKSFQLRKTRLLKAVSKSDNAKKFYAAKTKLTQST